MREIVIDRLEGSRRSIKGHHLEADIRTALVTAFQNYYSIHSDYGKCKKVEIAKKQIKIGNHTVDVSAKLLSKNGQPNYKLLIPIKTRETEGGGHAHIFTRDIVAAIRDLKDSDSAYHIVAVIVARNWSPAEISNIDDRIDLIFHFNMSPNKFDGFDEDSQIRLNQYIQKILNRHEE